MANQRTLLWDEPDSEFRFRIDAALKYRTHHLALRLNHLRQPRLPEAKPETKPRELCE